MGSNLSSSDVSCTNIYKLLWFYIYIYSKRKKRYLHVTNSLHWSSSLSSVNLAEEIPPALMTEGKKRRPLYFKVRCLLSPLLSWRGWGRTKFTSGTSYHFSVSHIHGLGRDDSVERQREVFRHSFLIWGPWSMWGISGQNSKSSWSWMGEILHIYCPSVASNLNLRLHSVML